MGVVAEAAELLLGLAVSAFDGPLEQVIPTLDAVPAAIVVVDAQGGITHFNRAFIDLTGVIPDLDEKARWPDMRVFTRDGEPLAVDQWPLSVALREQRAVRGMEAIAQRPDGTWFHYRPFPTPIFDPDGEFLGVINLMIDVTPRVTN